MSDEPEQLPPAPVSGSTSAVKLLCCMRLRRLLTSLYVMPAEVGWAPGRTEEAAWAGEERRGCGSKPQIAAQHAWLLAWTRSRQVIESLAPDS